MHGPVCGCHAGAALRAQQRLDGITPWRPDRALACGSGPSTRCSARRGERDEGRSDIGIDPRWVRARHFVRLNPNLVRGRPSPRDDPLGRDAQDRAVGARERGDRRDTARCPRAEESHPPLVSQRLGEHLTRRGRLAVDQDGERSPGRNERAADRGDRLGRSVTIGAESQDSTIPQEISTDALEGGD